MKFISTTQLKNNSKTTHRIIDDIISIDPNNIQQSIKDIKLIREDLEKVKEGLFYKNEEIKREMDRRNPKTIIKEFEQFERQFSKLNIEEAGPIKSILEDHKKVASLRDEYKLVNLLNEVKKNNLDLIEEYIKDNEEWEFLCMFLRRVLDESMDKDVNDVLHGYKKKIEENILETYEKENESKDRRIMKICFNAFDKLGKKDVIVKAFMFTLPIFQEVKKYHSEIDKIDLQFFENKTDSFFEYLDLIENVYQDELYDLNTKFTDSEYVYDMINKRLFEDLIMQQLEYLLKTDNPIIYLLNLTAAYKKTESTCKIIHSIYLKFETSSFIADLFEHFISNALFKEKEAFDLLFDIIARKKHTKINYVLQEKELSGNNLNAIKETTKMAQLITLFEQRSVLLKYDYDDVKDFYSHVVKKFDEYATFYCSRFTGHDRFELLKTLTDLYVIVKKVLYGKIELENFENAIEDRTLVIYINRKEECEKKLRSIIKSIKQKDVEGVNTEKIRNLLDHLKREYRTQSAYLKGQNGKNYMINLLKFSADIINEHFLTFKYDRNKGQTFYNDIKMIINYIKEINVMECYERYEYLLEISELIMLRKEDINIFMKRIKAEISESELKNILKCRDDYKEVKKLVL